LAAIIRSTMARPAGTVRPLQSQQADLLQSVPLSSSRRTPLQAVPSVRNALWRNKRWM